MQVIETIPALRDARRALKGRVGVVLTMGALHRGHLALVETARAENDHIVATIFVNPLQFGANEDLSKYPRDLPSDLALLEHAGVDVVFTPTPAIMYPAGFQTNVAVKQITQVLEGARRPGHFDGVATVVSKLFNLTQPDIAYFGQKDAQQVAVIKQMTRDLNFPLEIAVCLTVREESGLAMSSRNVYLSAAGREKAASLYRGLRAAGALYETGVRRPGLLTDAVIRAFAPDVKVEYVALNDPATLTPITEPRDAPMLLSLAVRLENTRLIDNCLLPDRLNTRAELSRILGGS